MPLNEETVIEDAREIWRAHLLRSFSKSWFECWDTGTYFDNERQPLEERFLCPNWGAIDQIRYYDFFTLFEAAILISQRTVGDNASFLGSALWVYVDAIVANQLMPRHPLNYLRWIDLPRHEALEVPDLNWVISRNELYCFASARWSASRFEDLHEPADDPAAPAIPDDQRQRTGVPTTSTLVIQKARITLLGKLNRDPTNLEIWNHLISLAGVLDSGVAEFQEDETSEADGRQGRICFVTANEGISKGIRFKTLQNRIAHILKFPPP